MLFPLCGWLLCHYAVGTLVPYKMYKTMFTFKMGHQIIFLGEALKLLQILAGVSAPRALEIKYRICSGLLP